MRQTRQTAHGREEEMTGSAKTSEARGAHSKLSKGDDEDEETIGEDDWLSEDKRDARRSL